jgi:UDP-N-acetylglucosamine--N-acetylmuramyl-(pentapeptide) pyrophosphoryl-undecaprenol N-acetylglucosamine transferase
VVNDQHERDYSPLFAFAGGGTGGHLYPAIAIASAIRRRVLRARFLFLGTERYMDERVLSGVDCELVRQTLPRISVAPWRWPGIVAGFRQSSKLCRLRFEKDRPAVVIGTGGLASVPAVREASRVGIPTVLLNPDAVPGRANRHLTAYTDVICAQWEETIAHFPRGATVRVLGCPVRGAFNEATRKAGIERFGLDADRKTLLVTGASQGARTVNEAVIADIAFLEQFDDWQILHLAGDVDYQRVRAAYGGRSVRATVLPFTEHMAEALAASDLVISRAGASTLAEITAMGRPAILMPYPFHKDMHQLANARCLASAPGGPAARIVHDAIDPAINAPVLREALESLMSSDRQRTAMAAAALRLGRGNAASDVAEEILSLAGSPEMLAVCESLEETC